MVSYNISLGKRGEGIAERFLVSKGFRTLRKNFRSGRWGEIDLVMMEKDSMVFVEVKTRRSKEFGRPEEAVTFRKLTCLRRAAHNFVLMAGFIGSLRIDVVSVIIQNREVKIDHFRNVDF